MEKEVKNKSAALSVWESGSDADWKPTTQR